MLDQTMIYTFHYFISSRSPVKCWLEPSMHNSNLDVMIAGSSCYSQQTFMCCFYQQEA